MLTKTKTLFAGSALCAVMAVPAYSQVITSEDATLDLMLTPDSTSDIVATVPADTEFSVNVCLEAVDWCRVDLAGTAGWVQKAALDVDFDRIPVMTYDWDRSEVVAVVRTDVDPTYETVIVYADANPVQTVTFAEPVAVGTVVPQDVTLYNVPDEPYSYVTLNERVAIVDVDTREIVYVPSN
ncbi:SH3 domain-containing protein [Roseivivax halotolerans]|uniref:SH3 domain-containing protein n=1 Tax=Roseivivax halotolerans TaxID=93684 RepID=A0A1I5ZDG8_9RHOB|nr:DUF1236 domain-containing protein [Roseivivax halotolerans]SFQ54472.1 SH3 domain-containing protein [Roseivivax halotolerans]